jgi:hypothetical protein
MRVVLVLSRLTVGPGERGKSLNDYAPNDFSLNDGSVGFIWTAEP